MSRLLEHLVRYLSEGTFNREGILWPFQHLKSKFVAKTVGEQINHFQI